MDENVLNETNTLTPEDNIYSRINEEMQNIDNTINGVTSDENSETIGLRQEVEELAEKLADDSNYIVTLTEDERLELELINEEIEEIHRLEKVLPRNIEACDKGINLLNKEIADISTRLRKHNIAVEKGYFSQLSEEDVATLQAALADKTTRLESLAERKEKIQTRFDGLGDRLKLLLKSQEKLNKISNGEKIDKYQKLLDKSRYDYLKSGLEALENRKAYIEANKGAVYSEYLVKDQNDEIAALKARIAELESGKQASEPENKEEVMSSEQFVEPTINDNAQRLVDAHLTDNEDLNIGNLPANDTSVENNTEEETEKEVARGETGMIVAPPTGMSVVDPEVDPFIDVYSNSKDLDSEREAEIEDAAEILKEKKKEGFFKRHLRKFLAAGVIVLAPFLIKGCTDMSQVVPTVPEDTNDKDSYSSTDEGITEENDKIMDQKFEIPGEETKTPVADTTVNEGKTSENKQEEVKPSTPDSVPEQTPDTPEQTPVTPEPIPDPIPDPTPEPEPSIETGTVELEAGEKMASVNDIINGNLNEDTVLSHGDEVGKDTGSAEIKDYTEEGNAVVEFEKTEETPTTTNSKDQIIKNLEEFMGGDITFTDEGNQWLDEMSGRTNRR